MLFVCVCVFVCLFGWWVGGWVVVFGDFLGCLPWETFVVGRLLDFSKVCPRVHFLLGGWVFFSAWKINICESRFAPNIQSCVPTMLIWKWCIAKTCKDLFYSIPFMF